MVKMAELMCNPLMPLPFTPRGMMKLSFDMMQQSAAAVRLFVPWPETRLALQEFQNKLEAFSLFAHVDLVLQIPPGGEVSLPELVKRTEVLEPYSSVWATEGLGYYVATKFCKQSATLRSLLNGERGGIPERGLVALHSGMGLAIATRVMETISPASHESEIRRVLVQFVTVCRDNFSTGYLGAAYESLGLVTRNLYPQMIPKLDQQLTQIDGDLLAYFWHGVGRGIYFAPTNFLPDGNSSGRALKLTCEEPRHELGKRNALAGLAWAMTLVNIRHPEILEGFLKHHGSQLDDSDAFINGVSSSVVIWRDSTVDDPYLKAFCRYQPDSSDSTLVERWERMVRRPCVRALESVYPALKARRRLGDAFRCNDAMAC
jgi:hypothetical protein